jgi:chromosome segregation ATPase
MPKPQQKIPEIPPDLNLFQIPRKNAPPREEPASTPSAPPQPPQPAQHQVHPPPQQHQQYQQQQHPTGPAVGGGQRPDAQSKYWEQKVKEHAAENLKLHQQLDAVTKHRDQLLTVLSSQQQGNAVLEEAKAALEAETVNARQLEQQLAHLQQRTEEATQKLAEREQEATMVRQRNSALEHQLSQSTSDLMQLRNELEAQVAEHSNTMLDLGNEVTKAKEATERADTALREQTARAREAASDLANLRSTHNDLQRQWEENRKSVADLNKRNSELEQRLADRTGEVQHLRAELDRRGASYVDEFALRARIKEELRQEYNARLATEQEGAVALRRQNRDMQERLNEALKELDELKRRTIDFTSSEVALNKQIQAGQALADKAQLNYGKEAARANRLEKTLEALRQTKEELQEKLSTERKEVSKFKRRAEALEKRIKKRGEEGVGEFGEGSDLDMRVRDSISALAKATADLEVERRKLESVALQSRLPSLDATRVGQAFANSLRCQLRPSADSLMQSIRRLLESSLGSEQKTLVEDALESALVIQAGLQETNSQIESAG